MFKKLKRYCKNQGVSLSPAIHLRNIMRQELTKGKQLLLSSLKSYAICDLVGSAPRMFGNCVQSQDIQHGFVKAGLLREIKPGVVLQGINVEQMFRTSAKTRGKKGAMHIAKMYTGTELCFPIMLAQGSISDDQLHHLGGLPYDTDKAGNVIIKQHLDADCESHQRAKVLSHPRQRDARRQKGLEATLQIQAKLQKAYDATERLLTQNMACEELLQGFRETEHINEFDGLLRSNRINKLYLQVRVLT